MLTKVVGKKIEKILIYDCHKGKRLFGYETGKMYEKVLDNTLRNFAIYYNNRGRVALQKPKDLEDYIIVSCVSHRHPYDYHDIPMMMKELIGKIIKEVKFCKRLEGITYSKLKRIDEYYEIIATDGFKLPFCVSILTKPEKEYETIPMIERYITEV